MYFQFCRWLLEAYKAFRWNTCYWKYEGHICLHLFSHIRSCAWPWASPPHTSSSVNKPRGTCPSVALSFRTTWQMKKARFRVVMKIQKGPGRNGFPLPSQWSDPEPGSPSLWPTAPPRRTGSVTPDLHGMGGTVEREGVWGTRLIIQLIMKCCSHRPWPCRLGPCLFPNTSFSMETGRFFFFFSNFVSRGGTGMHSRSTVSAFLQKRLFYWAAWILSQTSLVSWHWEVPSHCSGPSLSSLRLCAFWIWMKTLASEAKRCNMDSSLVKPSEERAQVNYGVRI